MPETTPELRLSTRLQTQVANLTEEQFKRLLDSLAMNPTSRKEGSFLNAQPGLTETEKLTVINIFKRSEAISEKKALEELPLLLQDFANNWCKGIKGKANDWNETVTLIREAFAQDARHIKCISTSLLANKK
ncbi:hypothetical protein HHI36_003936 [Cryptolaemus montrouzieri]|uniref:Uncharacterized protein n=1 Tax=Cryptolaemus montrouzieri TaxID=559131 RepID=A0ABD2NQ27_9CUCU